MRKYSRDTAFRGNEPSRGMAILNEDIINRIRTNPREAPNWRFFDRLYTLIFDRSAHKSIKRILKSDPSDIPADRSFYYYDPYITARDTHACPCTERAFAELEDFNTKRVVVDDNNTPLFISKLSGVNSSISLQPAVVNGWVFPPGSIFRVESPSREDQKVIPSYAVGEIACVRLTQLSLNEIRLRGCIDAQLPDLDYFRNLAEAIVSDYQA